MSEFDSTDYQEALIELDKEFPGAELDDSLKNYLSLDKKQRSLSIFQGVILSLINPFFIVIIALFLAILLTLDMDSKKLLAIPFTLFSSFNLIWNAFIIWNIRDGQ
jgi:threonine/homoserine/homoserine lactone efflux protein